MFRLRYATKKVKRIRNWRNGRNLLGGDLVLAMERKHLERIAALLPDAVFNGMHLGIPDEYEYMDPDLMELLRYHVEEAVEAYLG